MAEFQVTKYREKEHYTLWENFIDESVNGTIFHRQKFLSYHPKDRFEDHSLLFYEHKKGKSRLIALFPAAELKKGEQHILKSHAGASYGGLVLPPKISLRKVFGLLETLDHYATGKAFDKVEFRMAPKIFNRQFVDQLDFALLHQGYYREDEELATYYDLHDFTTDSVSFDEFIQQFPATSRKEIRKGVKAGLSYRFVQTGPEIEDFYTILNRNLQERYGKAPTHSLDELKKLKSLFPEDVQILGLFDGDKMIGGYLTLVINNQGVHIFYACLNYDYQINRPLNLGLAALIFEGAREGKRFLNYGISTEEGGQYINWGLFRFKEDFGGTGILRTYWIKELNATT